MSKSMIKKIVMLGTVMSAVGVGVYIKNNWEAISFLVSSFVGGASSAETADEDEHTVKNGKSKTSLEDLLNDQDAIRVRVISSDDDTEDKETV